MKIATFNKPVLRQLRKDLDTALATVANEYGIQFNIGEMRFSSQSFRASLSADIVSSGSIPTTEDGEVDLAAVAFGNTLPVNLQNRQFRIRGTTYSLVGVSSRRHKYPFTGVGPRGGRYKFTVEQVRNGLI